jgi:hypothetical protein
VPKVQHKPIKRSNKGFKRKEQKKTERCPGLAHRTVRCAPDYPVRPSPAAFSNGYNLVGGYKYHPNQPLQGVGAKQHSKSYNWHIQALPTTSIHWSILCIRFRPLQPTQVPQKREQAKESFSCEFSTSALWDSLRESVCYILWSFARGVLTPIELPPKFWRLVKLARDTKEWGDPYGVLSDPWEEEELAGLWWSVERGKGLKETRP